jgi:hypothetical protein
MQSNQTPMSRGRITARVMEVLSDWNKELEKVLAQQVEKQGLVLTGYLRDSFSSIAKANPDELRASLEVFFETYGRYSDLKVKYNGATPPISAMLDFVEKTGLSKFHYIPGYEGKAIAIGATRAKYPKTSAKNTAEMRIAWALKKSFKPGGKKNVIDRKDSWYNKTVNYEIRLLKDRLRDVMAAQLAEDIKDSF